MSRQNRRDRAKTRPDTLPPHVPPALEQLHAAITGGLFNPGEYVEAVLKKKAEEAAEAKLRAELYAGVYARLKDVPAAPWLGKDHEFANVLWLKAATWEEYKLFDVPPISGGTYMDLPAFTSKTVHCPGTKFYYANQVLPVGVPLTTAVTKKDKGLVFFDGPVSVPVLFELGGPAEDFRPTVWMGLTPMEVFTLRGGIAAAAGKVVVAGLGLGWFLKEVAAKPEVTEIVVVEKSAELLAWLRPVLEAKFPEVKTKVAEWVAADAYEHVGLVGRRYQDGGYTLLFDIWPALGDADYDHAFVSLEMAFGADRVWGWGRGATYGGEVPKLDPNARLPYPRAYVRTSPCGGCPFSRTGNPAEDGGADPLRLIGQAHGPFLLPCHREPGYETERQGEIYKKAQCAGAAIFRANVGVADRMPASMHALPADAEKVFATPAEEAERFLAKITPAELCQRELENSGVRIYGAKPKKE